MNWLFKLGIILLPFENFFFAPSAGWAALSPLIFATYVLVNIRFIPKILINNYKLFCFFLVGFCISLIIFILDNSLEVELFISSLISIGLGLISFMSFYLYVYIKKKDIKSLVQIIIIVYSISIIVGIIQYISYKYSISPITNLIISLQKRSYSKVQFTFTEPSFTSMHIYGILLPLYLKLRDKRLFYLMIMFIGINIIIGDSPRFLIDSLVIISIIILFSIDIKKLKTIVTIFCLVFCSGIVLNSFSNDSRIQSILELGIYADGSLASRYFRINASIKGYKYSFLNTMFGYGIGNALIPLRQGYKEAVSEYKSWFLYEVLQLGDPNYKTESVICMYVRMISEFGLIMTIIAIMYLSRIAISKEDRLILIIILYLYVQFDSYAFYSIWIYIVMMKCNRKVTVNIENKH